MEVDENFCALVVALSTSRILLRSQETRRDTRQTSSSRGERQDVRLLRTGRARLSGRPSSRTGIVCFFGAGFCVILSSPEARIP